MATIISLKSSLSMTRMEIGSCAWRCGAWRSDGQAGDGASHAAMASIPEEQLEPCISCVDGDFDMWRGLLVPDIRPILDNIISIYHPCVGPGVPCGGGSALGRIESPHWDADHAQLTLDVLEGALWVYRSNTRYTNKYMNENLSWVQNNNCEVNWDGGNENKIIFNSERAVQQGLISVSKSKEIYHNVMDL